MAKMKYWNGTTWEILDAKDADTLDGKHYSDIKSEIQTVQNNFNTHQNNNVQHIKYATASGTNTYTTTISGITSLTEGLSIKIKFTNANTGASTLNINGLGAKNIVKSNGSGLTSGNIKAGQICHLVYTGSVFQLLGEGGEYGTAQPEHVLSGYTIGTEEGIQNGTMTNYGSKTFTPSDSTQTSGAGYYSSITVNPRPTLSGNAGTSQVLSGYTFYSNNYTKQTGTMPNQGAKIITPSTVNQAIPAGYHNGQGYVKGDANLVASNIKSGVSIFGKIGTLKVLTTGMVANAGNDSYYGAGTRFSGSNTHTVQGASITDTLITLPLNTVMLELLDYQIYKAMDDDIELRASALRTRFTVVGVGSITLFLEDSSGKKLVLYTVSSSYSQANNTYKFLSATVIQLSNGAVAIPFDVQTDNSISLGQAVFSDAGFNLSGASLKITLVNGSNANYTFSKSYSIECNYKTWQE